MEGDDGEEEDDKPQAVMQHKAKMTTAERIQQMKEDLNNKRAAATTRKKGDQEESKSEATVIAPHLVRDFLASGSRDKSIRLWEAKSGKCIQVLIGHDNWVTDMCFHPNGKFLLSVSDDKSLRVWDLTSGRCSRKLLNIHSHFVTTIAIKQKTVVTGSVDQTLKVWNCR